MIVLDDSIGNEGICYRLMLDMWIFPAGHQFGVQ